MLIITLGFAVTVMLFVELRRACCILEVRSLTAMSRSGLEFICRGVVFPSESSSVYLSQSVFLKVIFLLAHLMLLMVTMVGWWSLIWSFRTVKVCLYWAKDLDVSVRSSTLFPLGYVIDPLFRIWRLCLFIRSSRSRPDLFSVLQFQSLFRPFRSPVIM